MRGFPSWFGFFFRASPARCLVCTEDIDLLSHLSLHSLALSPSQARLVICYHLNSVACMAVAGRCPVGTRRLMYGDLSLPVQCLIRTQQVLCALLRMPRPLDTLFSLLLESGLLSSSVQSTWPCVVARCSIRTSTRISTRDSPRGR